MCHQSTSGSLVSNRHTGNYWVVRLGIAVCLGWEVLISRLHAAHISFSSNVFPSLFSRSVVAFFGIDFPVKPFWWWVSWKDRSFWVSLEAGGHNPFDGEVPGSPLTHPPLSVVPLAELGFLLWHQHIANLYTCINDTLKAVTIVRVPLKLYTIEFWQVKSNRWQFLPENVENFQSVNSWLLYIVWWLFYIVLRWHFWL